MLENLNIFVQQKKWDPGFGHDLIFFLNLKTLKYKSINITMKIFKQFFGTLALLAISTVATAQVTETATVSGTVVEPITTTSSALNLGELIQEIKTTIATNDAGAAEFVISGATGKEVTVDFTLDANLSGTGADIPVAYTGEYSTEGATTASGTGNHDTSTQLTDNLDATAGDLYVWIGAEVTPAVDQTAGEYTGSLQIDVAYTGN
ncbi:MAG: DUF4402 domain-containing protein [Balneolaceae bacterium]